MKTKLKRCLAIMLILVTCFCTVDNNFIVGKFFASFIIPNVYAINPDDADDSQSTDIAVDEDQAFKDKMVEIARSIADDNYTSTYFGSVHQPYAYKWGGDGELTGRQTGFDNVSYCVFDCRGFVAGTIRYAAKTLNMNSALQNVYITWTNSQYEDLYTNLKSPKRFGCHKITSVSELQDGDILWRSSHTEIFFRKSDGTAMEVGAVGTPTCFNKAKKYGGGPGDKKPKDSIKEYSYQDGSWEAYFRYGTESDYYPTGTIGAGGPDEVTGQLGSGRWYTGEVDQNAELDEQVFDFQGNPQKMVYDGSTNFSMWLFTLLSQFLDFIAGLLVSLLINPIMQLLNAIVNFLTNFINYISGLPMGT